MKNLNIKEILNGLNGRQFTDDELKEFIEIHYNIKNIKLEIFDDPAKFYRANMNMKGVEDKRFKSWKEITYSSTNKESGRAWIDNNKKRWTISDKNEISFEDYAVIHDVEKLLLNAFESYAKDQRRMVVDKIAPNGFCLGQLFTPEIQFFKKGIFSIFVYKLKKQSKALILTSPTCKFDDNEQVDGTGQGRTVTSRPRLHSVTQPAVQWGKVQPIKQYYIHGVLFDSSDGESLWSDVCNRRLTPEEVISIDNMEQRQVAMKHYGVEKVFDALEKTLINESERGNKLYEVKMSNDRWRTPQLILRYKDPSTDRVYSSGIPRTDDQGNKIERADHAMAWKFSLTEDEYKHLIVEG
ncbi:uncharacterized protein METZ01_LOCUS148000 [marine metagenome]|uniref:Uncharacterized protein n=1 Tax=marine metagenome TaxID=408172 RepID=A0A382A0U8_9ZZZZ